MERDLKSRRVVTSRARGQIAREMGRNSARKIRGVRPWNTYLTRLNLVNVRT